MRLAIFICLLLPLVSPLFAQTKAKNDSPISFKKIKGVEVARYIDSLKTILYQDTLSFSRKDLIHRTGGTWNTKISSPWVYC